MEGRMKKIMILLMIACLAGCSYFVSMDELAENIQGQMQREFNTNPDYQSYRLTVVRVKILQHKDNSFEAVSQLNYQGDEYPVQVKIIKERGGYRWSVEDKDFAFIDDIEIEKYRQQLDRELQQLASSLDEPEPGTQPVTVQLGAEIRPVMEPVVQPVVHQEEPIPAGNITAYTR
jgi:hypothetical protein